MPNYSSNEVEREVRSRVNGAMEELIRRRNSELRELAASKFAPAPRMSSGPYEQMRVRVSIGFYEALFQQIADIWVDVLARQNGRISAGDVSHVVGELEGWAQKAPQHIRQALWGRGDTAKLLPRAAIDALEKSAQQEMNRLVATHRRELQTRLYNQDHPHPTEVQPVPNINIKINSDNTNSTVTSSHVNKIALDKSKKGWWETWWGVIVTGLVVTIVGGLIVWAIPRYFDQPSSSTGKPAASDPQLSPPFHKFYRQDQVGVGNIVCTGQRISARVAVQVSLAGSWYDPLKPFAPVGPLGHDAMSQTYIILRAFDKYHQDILREPYIHPNVFSPPQDYEVCVQLPAGFVINEKQNDLLNFAVEDSRVVSMTPK